MNNQNIGFRKLFVWKKGDELAFDIYKITKNFPPDEKFGIISQLRRAALSVPANIAEGYGRQNRKEFKQFLNISLGSLSEVEYLLEFSFKLGYLDKSTYPSLSLKRQEVGNLLWTFYKKL